MPDHFNIPSHTAETIVFQYVIQGKIIKLRQLNQHQSLVDIINATHSQKKMTMLMLAASNGDLRMLNFLLSFPGINVDLPDPLHYNTALMYAAAKGHHLVVDALLQTQAVNLTARNRYNLTAATQAEQNGHTDLAIHLATLMSESETNHHHPAESPESLEQLELSLPRTIHAPRNFQQRLEAAGFSGSIPEELRGKIFQDQIMNDPVTLSSGITFDREEMQQYFTSKHSRTLACPITRRTIGQHELTFQTNIFIKNRIEHFVTECEALRATAQERTTTTREPAENHLEHARLARIRFFGALSSELASNTSAAPSSTQ